MRRARLLCAMAMAGAPCAGIAADVPCAATLVELRRIAVDPHFASRWVETTMRDGKPLVVSIREGAGLLRMEFVKSGEGLWAEGLAVICGSRDKLEARMAKGSFRLGPAAPWLLRASGGRTDTVPLERLPGGLLRISLPGWSGEFAPQPDAPNTTGFTPPPRGESPPG